MLSKYMDVIDCNVSENLGRISNSLHLGLAGLMLYYFELSTYLNKERFKNKGQDIVHQLFLNLEEGRQFNVPNLFSFSSGLSGVFFALGHAVKNRDIDCSEMLVDSDIEKELFAVCIENIGRQETDPLHGGLGILYYLSTWARNDMIDSYLYEVLEEYCSVLKVDGYGARAKNVHLLDQVDNEFNLSLSHGMCGHLYILGNIRSEKCKDFVDNILKQELKYVFSNENIQKTKASSFFPSTVIELGKDAKHWERHYDVRLGWCYGDLNYSHAFLKIGRRFGDDILIDKAVSMARSTLHKTTFEATKIKIGDPFFCHGTVGLAYQYHVLYMDSRLVEFREASEYWAARTYEQLDVLDVSLLDRENYSLLEGLPGIVAMLLAIENGRRLSFDDIFFL